MKAEIITIGDELLIGQTVDTNSAWIGRELTKLGITVFQKTAVSDSKDHIITALNDACSRSQLVLITGGLGPTNDDITKHTLCEYFNTKLVFSDEAYRYTERFVAARGGIMNELNKSQAMQPENCTIIPNNTASGMWFEKDGTIIIAMPGVPHEMEQMMQETILVKITESCTLPIIVVKHVITAGIAEALLAEKIAPWEDALPKTCKFAYLPSPGYVKLRLMLFGDDRAAMELEGDRLVSTLKPLIAAHIFAYEDEPFAKILGKLLIANAVTIAVAESCTGGFIAHSFTTHAGSSQYFKGSITAYSNDVKTALLGVDEQMLIKHGAVSEPVVRCMAEQVKQRLHSDYAIATSGIAGPDGGSETKPVGTVWIAVSGKTTTVTSCFQFGNDRMRVIQRSATTALVMLKKLIEAENV